MDDLTVHMLTEPYQTSMNDNLNTQIVNR